jgi:hypothetical protein
LDCFNSAQTRHSRSSPSGLLGPRNGSVVEIYCCRDLHVVDERVPVAQSRETLNSLSSHRRLSASFEYPQPHMEPQPRSGGGLSSFSARRPRDRGDGAFFFLRNGGNYHRNAQDIVHRPRFAHSLGINHAKNPFWILFLKLDRGVRPTRFALASGANGRRMNSGFRCIRTKNGPYPTPRSG